MSHMSYSLLPDERAAISADEMKQCPLRFPASTKLRGNSVLQRVTLLETLTAPFCSGRNLV